MIIDNPLEVPCKHTQIAMVRLTPKGTGRTPNWRKGHSIDIINTNSTLESTLRPDIFLPNTKPLNDWINLAKTAIHRTVRQFQWDHPINHSTIAVSWKWVVCHLWEWDPHASMSLDNSPAKVTPSHSSIHLPLSLSLYTPRTRMNPRTTKRKDWGRLEKKKGGSTNTTPWMPSTSSILFTVSSR